MMSMIDGYLFLFCLVFFNQLSSDEIMLKLGILGYNYDGLIHDKNDKLCYSRDNWCVGNVRMWFFGVLNDILETSLMYER